MTYSIALLAIALALTALAWIGRRRRGWAVVLANVAAVFAALGLVEIHLDSQKDPGDGTRLEGSITKGFTHPDDVLGYAPAANARVTARKLYGDKVLYDVTYTTDAHGLRVSAPALPDVHSCVLFFGDSITFGEGVEDADTYAHVVSALAADRYRTYNFGYSGYGPHQMLAALQSGRVARIVNCTPKYIYYLCIPDHAVRITGIYPWDRHGPRFVLASDGSVVQRGHFDDDDPHGGVGAWIEHVLSGSRIWQRLFVQPHGPEPGDVPLLAGIVAQAARVAQERFPGSVFEVILWDGADERGQAIEAALAARGIRVRRMTSLVPDFYTHSGDYLLSTHDRHPNARFHHLMGEGIAREVMADEPPHSD
ncbi:MAG: hypothetical protein JSR90_20810 [Proteobacteria bacterium]|nr:hypothetical protein [Pseudomonadota bacterium]